LRTNNNVRYCINVQSYPFTNLSSRYSGTCAGGKLFNDFERLQKCLRSYDSAIDYVHNTWNEAVLKLGDDIMNNLKKHMPIKEHFMTGSKTQEEKFPYKKMQSCKGLKKMVKDMYGHYCFNFIGALGGFKIKGVDEEHEYATVVSFLFKFEKIARKANKRLKTQKNSEF
jgi:hypothetical protein